jgi:GNAT superfamily N-acetyltransferase
LRSLQALSCRTLGTRYYDTEAIEAFVAMGTMQEELIDDGTYFTVRDGDTLVGCGGWSTRVPNYSALALESVRTEDKATVRSIFVHPDWAGRGIGRLIMDKVEAEIAQAGFDGASLLAMLSGVPFYIRLGYRSGEPTTLRLPNGRSMVVLGMHRSLRGVSACARVLTAA